MQPVSVVIPNWNGADLLAANLPAALEAARRHPAAAEVLVVDDGSDDASRDVVRAHPGARLVVHERNLGFGAACLTGAREARHPLVFLLNSDARPEPDSLAPLCRVFDAPETFAASPLVLDEAGAMADVTINVPYLRRGRIRYRKLGTAALTRAGTAPLLPWYTFFPLGGAIVVHRERFLEIGGFDPMFHPFYYEDVDLGFRAWRRHWTCVVVPGSRVIHAGGGTIGRAFPKLRVRIVRKRNRILFHCKNLTGRGDPVVHLAQQALRILTRLLRLDATELLGTLAALPRLPAAFAGRRAERAAAAGTSEAEILACIDARWRANLAALGAGPESARTDRWAS